MNPFCGSNYSKSSALKEELDRQIKILNQPSEQLEFLTKHDENEMVDVLAEAFIEDPLMVWLTHAPPSLSPSQQKSAVLDLNKWLCRGMNKNMLTGNRGVVIGMKEKKANTNDVDCKLIGAMSIVLPNKKPPGIFNWILYSIMNTSPSYDKTKKRNYGPMHTKRLESTYILDEKREKVMIEKYNTKEYIYLQTIGVLKEYCGKGHGKRMLSVLFQASDTLQCPIYLETESESNESMYMHLGFKTVEKFTLKPAVVKDKYIDGDDGFLMYLMVRPPTPQPKKGAIYNNELL